jgi:hypothetical protein
MTLRYEGLVRGFVAMHQSSSLRMRRESDLSAAFGGMEGQCKGGGPTRKGLLRRRPFASIISKSKFITGWGVGNDFGRADLHFV